jgi:hypothetical protein
MDDHSAAPLPLSFDQKSGFSRSHRGTEMHENEIGTVIVEKQPLTYLRLTGIKLGYLLNFGEALMKDGITRTIH